MIKKHSFFLLLFSLLMSSNFCYTKWAPFITQKDPTTGKGTLTNKTIKDMSYEELLPRKNKHKEAGSLDVVIRYLETMEAVCPDAENTAQIKLELADAYFEDGQLKKAEKKYTEYASLYQGGDKMAYAARQQVLCCHYQSLDPDRDQSKTEETIELIDLFVKQYDTSDHVAQMKEIRAKCRDKLAQSEMSIIKDLISRKRYPSAQKRIEYAQSEFISEFPNLEVTLAEFETKLQEVQGTTVAKKEDNSILKKEQEKIEEKPLIA